MIAAAVIQTSLFHFIAIRSRVTMEPWVALVVRVADSYSAVGTRIFLMDEFGLSVA